MMSKYAFIIAFGLLMFAVGYISGGINYSWTDVKYSPVVSFWAMVGGWVSGLATLAAVVVSLYIAFKSSQNEVEKIEIKYSLSGKSGFGDSWPLTVDLINARNIHTSVTDVSLSIDDGALINVNHLAQRQLLPYVFGFKGESAKFVLNIAGGHMWWHIFTKFEEQDNLKFKKGSLVFKTNTRNYIVPLRKDIMKIIKGRYEAHQEIK